MKDFETAFIGTALLNPQIINSVRAYLRPDDMQDDRNARVYEWLLHQAIENPNRRTAYDTSLVASHTDTNMSYIINAITEVESVESAHEYASILFEHSLNEMLYNAAEQVMDVASSDNPNPRLTMKMVDQLYGRVKTRLLQKEDPIAENPSAQLENLKSWRTEWGIDALDRRTRLISSAVTLWVANSNSGKTSAAIQIAAHNAVKAGIPVDLYLAETPVLEAKIGVLVNLGLVPAWIGNEVVYNSEARTPKRIKHIHELWEEHISGSPLRIHSVTNMGIDDALDMISSGREHLKIVDHAYALVMQGAGFPGRMSVFEKFGYVFSNLATTATVGDNAVLVFNQLSNEQNSEEGWKAQTASFGGAAGVNIARTKINVRRQEDVSHGNMIYLDAVFTKTKGSGIVGIDRNGNKAMTQPDNETFSLYLLFDQRYLTGKSAAA